MELHYTVFINLGIFIWILIVIRSVIKVYPNQKKMIKASKGFILPIFVIILSSQFMPVKLIEKNMAIHEVNTKFNNIPEKVIINETSFSETQEKEFNNLKKESNNEIPK